MTKIHALIDAYARAAFSAKIYALTTACAVFTPIAMALLHEAARIIA